MGAKSQKRNINTQIIFTMMGLLILCVFFSITTKSFLTQRNLLNIATQTSVAVIVAIAETYIIASGCIDLSVGSGVAFSGLVVASAMKAGIPVPVAMLMALGTGMALGAFNAFVITVLGIVPFIATLGTNSIFRGLYWSSWMESPCQALNQNSPGLAPGSFGDGFRGQSSSWR